MPTKPRTHDPLPPFLQSRVAAQLAADKERRRKEYEGNEDRAADRAFYRDPQWLLFREGLDANQDFSLCRECLKLGKIVPREQIDHIIPRKERPDLAYDESNCQPLCKSCHRAKTNREIAMDNGSLATVVCGRPGSGKTTYVEQHRRAGDIVFDWDAIAAVMLNQEQYDAKEDLAGLAKHLRSALAGWCSTFNKQRRVWVIVTDRAQAKLVSEQIKGRLIVLDVEVEECKRRIADRDGDMSSRMKAIQEWR